MTRIGSLTRGMVIAAILVVDLATNISKANTFVDEIKRNHSNIFTATVLSGNLIAAGANECFYEYKARVTENLHGSYEVRNFVFYSESHLTLGESYLLFYDQEFSKLYRPLAVVTVEDQRRPESSDKAECAKLLKGPFLIYDEIHLVTQLWSGQKMEKVVEFNDPSMNFPADEIRNSNAQFVTFDLLKEQLRN